MATYTITVTIPDNDLAVPFPTGIQYAVILAMRQRLDRAWGKSKNAGDARQKTEIAQAVANRVSINIVREL